MTTTSLPPHPWSSDIKEYHDLDGASVGTVGYVYDANGVELAVVYRMLDPPAVLPLLTAAPELLSEAQAALAFLDTVTWNDDTSERNGGDLMAALEHAIAKAGAL